ncbi:uncharacterized protein LOC110285715 [Mus caroli]|uniref:Uncharacterized protein LOC110285715 n=1 Tax=Mus caroli TaxID=10089 RepID=A0A6P5P245_MUSCR|nr:uncharacterized protein LOC110285715 [Mus caroli]
MESDQRARPGPRRQPRTLHHPGGLRCARRSAAPERQTKGRAAGRAPRLASPRFAALPQACPAHAGSYPEPRPSEPQPGRRARGAGSVHAADRRPRSPRLS